MIMPVCLKPYPGELLYGWIMRLTKANGYPSMEAFCSRYLYYGEPKHSPGKGVSVRLDYHFNLEHICKRYESIKSFPDLISILKDMTPLISLFPFMTRGYQAEHLEIVLRDRTGGKLDIPSMQKDITEIHLCPECMEEDKKLYGEHYLHTAHHLPGVRMCAKHHKPLMRVEYRKEEFGLALDENLMAPVPLMADLKIENKISEFMQAIFEHIPDLDLIETQAVILERMEQMGYATEMPYGNIANDLLAAGYGRLFAGDTGTRVYKLLSQKKVVPEDIIALLVFLFQDYDEFYKVLKSGKSAGTKQLSKDIFPGYTIRLNAGWIAELECQRCGEEFHIHPYALLLGRGCPECEKKMDPEVVFQHQLQLLGDGHYKLEGEFPGYGRNVKIRHETCGKTRSVNASELIWMEKRCYCETFLTKEQLQDRIDKSRKRYTLIEYKGGQKIGQIVTIRHEGCGKQFTIGLREFEKRPFCRCCNEGYTYTEQFERKFKELVGEEYEIVTTFRRQNEPVEVRHRKCGTITKGLPSSFLKGKRCALCTPEVPKKDMIKHVNECTGGRYHVSMIERNKITVCDSEGKSITDTVQFFLQELSRDTESPIFNYRVEKPNIPLREAAVVYFMIKAECEKWGIWLQKEADRSIMDYNKIKLLTAQLIKEGYIFRKQTGVFCLDAALPDESIIREMYLNRRGEQIGAYYHESAAFHAGIIDTKPEIEYILSSNVKVQDFRSYMVGNTEIKIREPYAKITDKNYTVIEAINLLMFSGKHPEYKHKVEDYLLKKRISIADMEPYFEQYPFMIWKIVKELYR